MVSTSGSSGIQIWQLTDSTGYGSCLMSAAETSDNSRDDAPDDPPGAAADFGFRVVPEAEKAPLVRAVFDSVAGRYDLMNDLMSAGIHRWWKAEMVRVLNPRKGQRLLDVAGGTGDIARRALPLLAPPDAAAGADGGAAAAGVVVCDANRQMLETGRAGALDDGILAGIEWLCGDAEALPFADRSFDLYTIAFGLRNVTRIERALSEARRVLKPGGRFLCLEFTPAVAPLIQPLYDFYSFEVLPLLGQIVTGNRDAYTYLVESIRRFPSQSVLAEMVEAAGLERARYRNLTGGIAALHSAWRL
jgi:demethylmenaquinone methyltransferase/2-methoxy-6-polyprenyl-1,4-benzoquinol methylase